MYSNWSEYKKHEGDRSWRKQNNSNDRWEGKFEAQIPRDSHRGDGLSSTKMGSRSREYIDSPSIRASKDSPNRDWTRMSPVRRRVSSSSVWDAPEKRSRRYTEDDGSDGRYGHESLDQLLGDSFSHHQKSKDFKNTPSRKDDFRYRRSPPDFRSRNWRDELAQEKRQEDLSDRNVLKRSDGKRRQEHPRERTHSPDHFIKTYVDRERMDNPPSYDYHEDYRQEGTWVPSDKSSKEVFGSDSTPLKASFPESKSSTGFQRFLNVLNMGVNVDALNQLVSQPSTEVVSQSSIVEGLSQSPPLEKFTLTPEDEEKCKQMQSVLQAIGVDLGAEELGQMNHRIQERLYGRKDGEEQRVNREKQEIGSRHRSRSPISSRSSFSPTSQDCSVKQHLCSFSRSLPEVDQRQLTRSAEYSQMMSSSSFQSRGEIKTTSQTAGWNVPSPTSTNPIPLTPPMPTYPPIRCPPPLYPPPSAPPPFPPPTGSHIFSPHLPPLFPHRPSPPNISPHVFAQIRPFLPPNHNFFSPVNVNLLQAQNTTTTSKPRRSNIPPRPRCLHVIK